MSGDDEPPLTAEPSEVTAVPALAPVAPAPAPIDVDALIAMAVQRIAAEVRTSEPDRSVAVPSSADGADAVIERPEPMAPIAPARAAPPIPAPEPVAIEDVRPPDDARAVDPVSAVDAAEPASASDAAAVAPAEAGPRPVAVAPLAVIPAEAARERSIGGGLWRSRLSGWTWRQAAEIAAGAVAAYFALVLALIVLYRVVNPPGSTLMAYQWLTGTEIQRTWVPIEDISPNLLRAVVVSEDWGFCNHYGIDLVAIEKALEQAGEGVPRGASTISMQVIKNLFLTQSKSYLRKAVEIPLTFVAELVWPKSRMLEIYLNIAEWGPGIFGAEAAARHHFGKPAAQLSEREAALLAASLPNPMIRDAGDPGPRTARKASVIQARMRAAGPVADCAMPKRAANRGSDWQTTVKKRAGTVPGL